MREKETSTMVMSQTPRGKVLITLVAAERLGEPDTLTTIGRACSDAVATEVVAMTEEAFADFINRHGGRPVYPTLRAYPYPRGD